VPPAGTCVVHWYCRRLVQRRQEPRLCQVHGGRGGWAATGLRVGLAAMVLGLVLMLRVTALWSAPVLWRHERPLCPRRHRHVRYT